MRNYLTQIELACVHLQEPEDLPIITVALWFPRRLKRRALLLWLNERMGHLARFRSKVAFDPLGLAYWQECEDFQAREHIEESTVSEEELWSVLGDLHSEPLPLDRPLWRTELLQLPSRSVAVFRVNHAVADGLALMSLLSPEEESRQRKYPKLSFIDRLRHVFKAIWGALGLLLLWWDPPNRLKGKIGIRKRLALTSSWSVEEMKSIAHRANGTINDLLVAILAGAMQRYLPEGGPELKVVIPVALRTTPALEMSNRFGLVFLRLPMDCQDPAQRLSEAKLRMDRLKDSGQAQAVFLIFNSRGLTPGWFDRWMTRMFAGKATTMMTNLRGPTSELTVAGLPVEDITFWASQVGHLAVGVNVMSYRGQLRVGVAGDANVLPYPDDFVKALEASWNELRH
jgi:diacylglycerol O-acyltransferase